MRFSKSRFLRWLSAESGQVLVMTVFCMAVLIGALGLAVDVGVLFHARRQMQTAADAAAMAGATELFYGNTSNIDSAAYDAAKANGVDHNAPGVNVIVTLSPTLNPGAVSCATCVQVAVSTPNPTIFMATLNQWMFHGTDFNSINVSAKAVAGAPGYSDNCVWLMDPTMGGKKGAELDLQGGAKSNVVVDHCGIYLNSNASDAVGVTGNPNLSAGSVNIVGNDTAAQTQFPGVPVNINVPPQTPDIPMNLSGTPTCTSSTDASIIYPAANPPKKLTGTASDASVSGSSSNNVVCFTNPGGVTLNDGVVLLGALGDGVLYQFQHGVTLAGAATFGSATVDKSTTPPQYTNTKGATLDIAGGSFSQANGALSIYAPTSGTYHSIALMQPSTNTTDNKCPAAKASPCLLIQRGNSGAVFDGIIYAPGEYVELQDAAGGVYASGLIAKGLYNKTSGLYIYGYSQYNKLTTPFKLITLVE